MNVLITGGAGFIGSSLAKRLLAVGHRVVIADDLSGGKRSNVPDGAEFLQIDVSRPESSEVLPRAGIDAVCHLAAQSSGPRSAVVPYRDIESNAVSTLILSRWCMETGVPRFFYASSMAIYGNPDAVPVSEDTTCAPVSYYGVSKLASEHLLRLASAEGLSVTCFRMFSVYGPGQDLANLQQGILSIYLAYMLAGVEVPVTGSLERFRDFVYIDDVVDAWMRALALDRTPSTAYNLGSGLPTTVRTLLAELQRALVLPATYPVRELPGSHTDQFGLFASIERARTELGWEPRTSLAEGIRTIIEWARTAACRP